MRRQKRRSAMLKKIVVMFAAVVLIVAATIGGTLAWLADKTVAVENTFTVGDIEIDLKENTSTDSTKVFPGDEGWKDENWNDWGIKNSYDFVPGVDLSKSPYVKVEPSEPCWLFVKVSLKNWPNTDKIVLDFSNDDDGANEWSYLDQWPAESGELMTDDIILYKELSETTKTEYHRIINNNTITVSQNLTKAEMNAIQDALDSITNTENDSNAKEISLTFTAYAIQKDALKNSSGTAITTAKDAWEVVSGLELTPNEQDETNS